MPLPLRAIPGNHFERGRGALLGAEAIYVMSDVEYTYDELVDALNAEAATIPEETWRDGVWDVHGYIVEAGQVGIVKVILGDDDFGVEPPEAAPAGDERTHRRSWS